MIVPGIQYDSEYTRISSRRIARSVLSEINFFCVLENSGAHPRVPWVLMLLLHRVYVRLAVDCGALSSK